MNSRTNSLIEIIITTLINQLDLVFYRKLFTLYRIIYIQGIQNNQKLIGTIWQSYFVITSTYYHQKTKYSVDISISHSSCTWRLSTNNAGVSKHDQRRGKPPCPATQVGKRRRPTAATLRFLTQQPQK